MFTKIHTVLKNLPRMSRSIIAVFIYGFALSACTISRQVVSQPERTVGTAAVQDRAVGASASNDPAATSLAAVADATLQPTIAAATNEPASKLLTGPEPAATALISSHRVVAGDTLTQIAERYAVSVAALLRANDLPNPNLLEVGQIIALPAPPVDYTPAIHILPDSLLVRSITARDFDVDAFINSHVGGLKDLTVHLTKSRLDGTTESGQFSASEIISRVSLEYSVDPRILIAVLEYAAGMLTEGSLDEETRLFPLRHAEAYNRMQRAGLYNQLSWLADQLNQGYYGWKYRGEVILELSDGSRLFFEPNLNAGTVAVQRVLAQLPRVPDWRQASGEAGIVQMYQDLFGDPDQLAHETVPSRN